MESISDSQDGITINMVDADITVLIETISKMTGKSFIIDNNVKGKVNVISPEKLSPEEAYRLFESVLEVNGFALEPAGNVIKVVPVSSATPDPLTMRISLSRTMVSSALENKSGLMKQLVFTSFSENDLKGVLASNLEANSLWRRMGLRNGDVLVAVDGKPLTTVDQMAAFLENLKSSNTVSLEIKRRDQVRSIIYRIQ
jgi:type II secretory pathway component GspD/PulD (secretin)